MQCSRDVSQHTPWIIRFFSKSSPTLFYSFGSCIKYAVFISALFPICDVFTSEMLRNPDHSFAPSETAVILGNLVCLSMCILDIKLTWNISKQTAVSNQRPLTLPTKSNLMKYPRKKKSRANTCSPLSVLYAFHIGIFSSDSFSIHLLSITLLESTSYFSQHISTFIYRTLWQAIPLFTLPIPWKNTFFCLFAIQFPQLHLTSHWKRK